MINGLTAKIEEEIHLLPESAAGRRLDQVLSEMFPQFSRTRLQTWLSEGKITLDGKTAKAKLRVKGGESIWILPEPKADNRFIAENIHLDIIHQDDHIIVLNKPAGLVVHPGAGNPNGTLLNALLHYDPNLTTVPRAGIVHRIDKDTTGLLAVARSLPAHKSLVDQLKLRKVNRKYWAIVQGAMTGGGTIDAPISRHQTLRQRMRVNSNGRVARTRFRVSRRFRNHTLVTAELDTGRTHQIRVHMAHQGYPIVGDRLYARQKIPPAAQEILVKTLQNFRRQALHAGSLSFLHPETSQLVSFEAPFPEDFRTLCRTLTCYDT